MSRQASRRNAFSLLVRRFPSVLCFTINRPSRVRPKVGEAEEGEGLGSPLAAPLTREGRKSTEPDQPRLALMEHQAKAGQPRLEGQEHLLRIRLALEAHDEVVRIAHGHNGTACAATAPLMGPEIEDVVQKYVGEERTDAPPCRVPLSVSCFSPLSRTPARSHISMNRKIEDRRSCASPSAAATRVRPSRRSCVCRHRAPVEALAHDRRMQGRQAPYEDSAPAGSLRRTRGSRPRRRRSAPRLLRFGQSCRAIAKSW